MRETFLVIILNMHNKKTMKKWSLRNRRGGYHKILLKKIITLLEYLSGNEVNLLLKDLYQLRKLDETIILSKKADIAINNISKICNETKLKKSIIIAIKNQEIY